MANRSFIDMDVSISDVNCWTYATRVKEMIGQEPELLFKYMISMHAQKFKSMQRKLVEQRNDNGISANQEEFLHIYNAAMHEIAERTTELSAFLKDAESGSFFLDEAIYKKLAHTCKLGSMVIGYNESISILEKCSPETILQSQDTINATQELILSAKKNEPERIGRIASNIASCFDNSNDLKEEFGVKGFLAIIGTIGESENKRLNKDVISLTPDEYREMMKIFQDKGILSMRNRGFGIPAGLKVEIVCNNASELSVEDLDKIGEVYAGKKTSDMDGKELEELNKKFQCTVRFNEKSLHETQRNPYSLKNYISSRQAIDEVISGIHFPDENDPNREKKIMLQAMIRLATYLSYDHDMLKLEDSLEVLLKRNSDLIDPEFKELLFKTYQKGIIETRDMTVLIKGGNTVCAGYAEALRNTAACLGVRCWNVAGYESKVIDGKKVLIERTSVESDGIG